MAYRPMPPKDVETVGLMISRFIRQYYYLRREGVSGVVVGRRFGRLLGRSSLTIFDVCESVAFKDIHRLMGKNGNQVFFPKNYWDRFSHEEKSLLQFSVDKPHKDLKKLRRDTSPQDGGFRWAEMPASLSMRDLDKE